MKLKAHFPAIFFKRTLYDCPLRDRGMLFQASQTNNTQQCCQEKIKETGIGFVFSYKISVHDKS